jgi:hypothetical protein
MTKRTPLQEHRTALEKRRAAEEKARREFEARRLKAVERPKADRDKIIRAEADPSLSPEERLEIFKSLQGWPRIVLGLYEAELEKARSSAHHGKPSDIAYEKVGKVLGLLGPDRIKALCNEARRQLKEGMPAGFVVKMTAAEFERRILRRNRTARRKRTG